MNILKYRKIYFVLSLGLFLGSLVALLVWGLNLSIDFTGGSLLEVEFLQARPTHQLIEQSLSGLGQIHLQSTGQQGLIIRLRDIDEETHQKILDKLGSLGPIEEKRFESIGPLIGQELKRKALWAILLALIAIIIYIAWAFRKVSRPVASWQYGLVAIVALSHDIFITLGIFALLGHLYHLTIGLPLVAAFLTILGYSVNNTIVIFDRLRENLLKTRWEHFETVVDQSINQSLTRCLNTALTTLFVLGAVFFLGGQSIRNFVLALIIGIIVGTYSSIFLTSPLVVVWQQRRSKKKLTR